MNHGAKLNHEHDLNIDTGNIIGNAKREYRCEECGYRDVKELYELNSDGDTILGCNYEFSGEITIPSYINGVKITKIGDGAFENQNEITSVTVPSTITEIGNNAFKGCAELTSITIPYYVTNIGIGVFAGCDKLNISVEAANPYYTTAGNILYNKSKTEIVAVGQISENNITIPRKVTKIAPYAYFGKENIETLRFDAAVDIGAYAFADCANLRSVYFETYDAPSVGAGVFSNSEFTLYAPYNSLPEFTSRFGVYTSSITARQIIVTFISLGETADTKVVYNGSTISELPSQDLVGYEFGGWYGNATYTGKVYENGGVWESETDLILYSDLTPNQYTVTLDAGDGTLSGDGSLTVTYGETFSVSASAHREGYTLDGWYDSDGKKYLTSSGESVIPWDKADNAVLYARWALKCYEIQIKDGNKIVWLGANGVSDESCSIEYGTELDTINLIYAFKNSNHGYKDGKIFDRFEYNGATMNWTSVPDLGENGTIITIVPIWILEEHTVYFDTLCGIAVNGITAKYDENISLPSVSREGYTFGGWYTASTGGTKAVWVKMPDLTAGVQNNGSCILYARWTAHTYTVTYVANGGSGSMSVSVHTFDETKALNINAFYRTNYNFIGWATSADGAVEYADGAQIGNLTSVQNGRITLYDVWQGVKYKIHYCNVEFNGRTASVLLDNNTGRYAPEEYEYGIGLDIDRVSAFYQPDTPYSPYLIFLGWYTGMGFTTKASSISATDTGEKYWYARWRYDESVIDRSGTRKVTDKGPFKQSSYDTLSLCWKYDAPYNELYDLGIRYLAIDFKLNMWEIEDGYQEIYIYGGSGSDNLLWSVTNIEHGGNKKSTTPGVYHAQILIDITKLKDFDTLYIRYSAHGFGNDDWANDRLYMGISYVVDENDFNNPRFTWYYKDPFK